MKTKHFVLLYILIIALIVALIVYRDKLHEQKEKQNAIKSFEDCAAAGRPVQESYPRRCSADGKVFTETIHEPTSAPVEPTKIDAHADLIRISTPQAQSTVSSPLLINGKARGSWFFEASFPVVLEDENGKQIASGIAQAQDEWMTEEFVPFTTSLNFTKPETDTGRLILKKDNPSGLAEHDDEISIPLRFQ